MDETLNGFFWGKGGGVSVYTKEIGWVWVHSFLKPNINGLGSGWEVFWPELAST